jgi:hypothetical protein
VRNILSIELALMARSAFKSRLGIVLFGRFSTKELARRKKTELQRDCKRRWIA